MDLVCIVLPLWEVGCLVICYNSITGGALSGQVVVVVIYGLADNSRVSGGWSMTIRRFSLCLRQCAIYLVVPVFSPTLSRTHHLSQCYFEIFDSIQMAGLKLLVVVIYRRSIVMMSGCQVVFLPATMCKLAGNWNVVDGGMWQMDIYSLF